MHKNETFNILVTGGAGFIGSHIVDKYIECGHKVWILDNLSTGKIENINPKAELIKMDIRDKNIETIFKKVNFDIVNHHAAQINIRTSVENPIEDAEMNILGTINLLENIKKHNVKKIIFASSGGAIYGECDIPKDENSEKVPDSPYGIAKYTNEMYIKFYAKNYKLNYSILRYGNVYGPRQNNEGEAGVISIFFTKMLFNEDVNIFGDGEQVRDYVYVGDVVEANYQSLFLEGNNITNVATGEKTSVNELFKCQKELSNFEKYPKYLPARIGEIKNSTLNIEKMKKDLKINPKNLKEGLTFTYNFYNEKYFKKS